MKKFISIFFLVPQFIMAQAPDLTLEELAEKAIKYQALFEIAVQGTAQSTEREQFLKEKKIRIEEKIENLQKALQEIHDELELYQKAQNPHALVNEWNREVGIKKYLLNNAQEQIKKEKEKIEEQKRKIEGTERLIAQVIEASNKIKEFLVAKKP